MSLLLESILVLVYTCSGYEVFSGFLLAPGNHLHFMKTTGHCLHSFPTVLGTLLIFSGMFFLKMVIVHSILTAKWIFSILCNCNYTNECKNSSLLINITAAHGERRPLIFCATLKYINVIPTIFGKFQRYFLRAEFGGVILGYELGDGGVHKKVPL